VFFFSVFIYSTLSGHHRYGLIYYYHYYYYFLFFFRPVRCWRFLTHSHPPRKGSRRAALLRVRIRSTRSAEKLRGWTARWKVHPERMPQFAFLFFFFSLLFFLFFSSHDGPIDGWMDGPSTRRAAERTHSAQKHRHERPPHRRRGSGWWWADEAEIGPERGETLLRISGHFRSVWAGTRYLHRYLSRGGGEAVSAGPVPVCLVACVLLLLLLLPSRQPVSLEGRCYARSGRGLLSVSVPAQARGLAP